MFDFRFIDRDGAKILQVRKVNCQIGWSKGDDHPVIQPVGPINFNPEKNWTPWEDIPGQCVQAVQSE